MADAKLLYVLPPTAISRWRDRCAWRASNFILNHVATKDYRDRLQLCIERGLRLQAKRSLADYERDGTRVEN